MQTPDALMVLLLSCASHLHMFRGHSAARSRKSMTIQARNFSLGNRSGQKEISAHERESPITRAYEFTYRVFDDSFFFIAQIGKLEIACSYVLVKNCVIGVFIIKWIPHGYAEKYADYWLDIHVFGNVIFVPWWFNAPPIRTGKLTRNVEIY